MRIMYLIPAQISNGRLGSKELERRGAILRKYTGADVEVIVRDTPTGPYSVESVSDECLCIPPALDAIRNTDANAFSAIILGCFGDPGLKAARQTSQIPVIGPCETSVHLAATLGYRFGVITVLDGVKSIIQKAVQSSGLDSRLASIRVIQTSVLDVGHDRDRIVTRLVECGKRAVEEDGVDSLVLGCMSLGFLELTTEVSARLGVPVVNPVLASLKAAETLVLLGLSHSKTAYPFAGQAAVWASVV